MKYRILVAFILSLLFARNSWSSELTVLQDPGASLSNKEVSIALRQTGCYGTCAQYKVTLFADGLTIFDGARYTEYKGIKRLKRPPEDILTVLYVMQKNDFLKIQNQILNEEDGCKEFWTDHSSIFLELSDGKHSHEVYWYLGCKGHKDIPKLQAIKESILNAAKIGDLIESANK